MALRELPSGGVAIGTGRAPARRVSASIIRKIEKK